MNAEKSTTIKASFAKVIEMNLNPDIYTWFVAKAVECADKDSNYQLNMVFSSIPRKTGKKQIVAEVADLNQISEQLPGFTILHWAIDRLSRVWLLMQLNAADKDDYVNKIENLFPHAEMNEQVALYSALPVLDYPEAWELRCAEGIRSNIGTVLEAIMYHNPYPALRLNEAAWNQLVMKAFFTGKNVNNITGLDQRANQDLAKMLFDYVEERWAAGREVDPQLWRITGKFMDDEHFYMLEKLLKQGNETDQQAAALACADSSLEKAAILLNQFPEYKKAIDQKNLGWEVVANKH